MFKDAPDLLSEFKDFLPDAVPANIGPGGGVLIMPQPTGRPWESSPPNVPAKKSTQSSRRNRKRVEKDLTPVLHAKSVPSRVCAS